MKIDVEVRIIMLKLPSSIFNDVIGPVMRGPSSSHVAGAARIVDLVRQSMKGKTKTAMEIFEKTERHFGISY